MADRARAALAALLTAAALVLASGSTGPVVRAASDCPPLPTTLKDLIAVEVRFEHPLSEAYPRAVWPYTEGAAACFGERAITVAAFVAGPEGLGGVTAFQIKPTWVLTESFVAVDRSTTEPDADTQFFVLAVPPRLERVFAADTGRQVRITGHFNDPVAETCRVTHGDPPDAPPADVAIDICRTAFVLTAIRLSSGAPGTDTARPVARDTRAPVPMGTWWLLAVGLTAFVGALWRVDQRRR